MPIRALLPLLLCSACIAPWAVMPAGVPHFGRAVFPPGSQQVEIPVAEHDLLRGVFVPGQPGAPVVLHLLEAMASVSLGCLPEDRELGGCGFPVLWDLQGLGYASLMVDYRGVGASTGSRHIDHLVEDARAMWGEAVARAGGDAQRVVVRSTSLGTIGAADLILQGRRPGLWLMFAPIYGETVASNVLHASLSAPVAWLADSLSRSVSTVSLDAAVAAAGCPTVGFLHDNRKDVFLSPLEHDRLQEALERRSFPCHRLNQNHIECAGGGHWIRPEERQLLRELFGCLAPVDARVAQALAVGRAEDAADSRVLARLRLLASAVECAPELALAAARSWVPPSAVLPWTAWLERRSVACRDRRSLEDWQRIFDLDHPSGTLDAHLMARIAPWLLARDLQCAAVGLDALATAFADPNPRECLVQTYYDGNWVGRWALGLQVCQPVLATACDVSDPHLAISRIHATLAGARGVAWRSQPMPKAEEAQYSINAWVLAQGPTALDEEAGFAAAPDAMAGLDPAVLREVFLAELHHATASVPEALAVAEEAAEVTPWIDLPGLFAALLHVARGHTLAPSLASWLDESWLRRAVMKTRGMPWDALCALATGLLLADAAAGVEADPPARAIVQFAKDLVPARPTATRGLEVWRAGTWRPEPLPARSRQNRAARR